MVLLSPLTADEEMEPGMSKVRDLMPRIWIGIGGQWMLMFRKKGAVGDVDDQEGMGDG